jgi:hypothetical protein
VFTWAAGTHTVMGDYYKLHLLLRWCRNAL